jgi:uncharacterized protein involved in type VI secretion and phage assembly
VLGRYAAWASWRWAPCVSEHLQASAQAGVRPYTVQYRETDLAFLQRLLAREGLAYRFEESEDGQPGPTVVFFADSTSSQSCPEDAGSAAWGGVRFHRDGVQEGQDTIQAFGGQRQQAVAVLSATRYDPEQARLVAAEVATAGSVGGENAPGWKPTRAWARAATAPCWPTAASSSAASPWPSRPSKPATRPGWAARWCAASARASALR